MVGTGENCPIFYLCSHILNMIKKKSRLRANNFIICYQGFFVISLYSGMFRSRDTHPLELTLRGKW